MLFSLVYRTLLCCNAQIFTEQIRGHGGNLYFEDTLVTSWDTTNKEVQEKYTSGRSFINCLSEKMVESAACAKNDMGECRMVRRGVASANIVFCAINTTVRPCGRVIAINAESEVEELD